jgi:hydroxymethylpyrimidine pyrophosphatase-like HAD family hydrolase
VREPKLVASDVDGTLLPTGQSLSPRTASVVRRVVGSGTPFVLVSGRPPRWIPEVADAAGTDGYAVCSNGAVLYDIGRDRVLAAHTMPPDMLRDVSRILDGVLGDYGLAAERIGARAVDEQVVPFVIEQGYVHPWGGDGPVVSSRAEVLGRPSVKLLVSKPEMSSDELADAVLPLLGDTVTATFSAGGGILEICCRDVTKASGMRTVADMHGVAAADVLAFGDMPNDIAMLEWAGHGVAMRNGHPGVLAVADEVTASNSDDGVAAVLERWW